MKDQKITEDVVEISNKHFVLGQADEFGRKRLYPINGKNNVVPDDILSTKIQVALNEAPNVNTGKVKIFVHSGHVTITGVVNSLPEKFECEDIVHNLSGVHSVINDLEVKGSSRRTSHPIDEFGYH